MLKKSLILIFLFGSLFFSLITSFASKQSFQNQELNLNNLETKVYQNQTISYPSWNEGEFYQTYSQYGELLLLPFESTGGWQSEIVEFNTIYLYNYITICDDSDDISFTIYLEYEDSGFVATPAPLNYTMNSFLNGNWKLFVIFNFTKLVDIPVIFNFTFYYFYEESIIPSINSYSVNTTLEIVLILSIFLFLLYVYVEIRSLSLMTIVYLIFLILSVAFFLDLTIPFYPFVQLFFLSISTYLFLDLMLDYRKMSNRRK